MNSIGQELKKQRELRQINLEDIANDTKISMRFLRAIEEDNFQILPEGVYRRNFIASYASYIGIDSQALVNIYKEMFEKIGSYQSVQRPRFTHQQLFVWIGTAVAFVLVAVIIIIYGFRNHQGITQTRVAAPLVQQLSKSKSAENITLPQSNENSAMKNEYVVPATKAVGGDHIVIDIVALQDTWLEVKTDGNIYFKWLLKKSEKRTFIANKTIEFITIGNAGGIEAYYKKQKLQSFGKTGQIIKNLIISKETIKNYAGNITRP